MAEGKAQEVMAEVATGWGVGGTEEVARAAVERVSVGKEEEGTAREESRRRAFNSPLDPRGSGLLFFMFIRPQPATPVWELILNG